SPPPSWGENPGVRVCLSLSLPLGCGRGMPHRTSGPSQEVPPAELAPGWGGKRSIVVADDAAFRERSKMLTAMERQKWLNSYMQKLLVVNPD
uniref:Tuberoinfundibular peptide of 39 residues n=1 Tax=Gopherus evgoodei TaxID=1825980 RepID=A0A8C4WIF3_9SAUR